MHSRKAGIHVVAARYWFSLSIPIMKRACNIFPCWQKTTHFLVCPIKIFHHTSIIDSRYWSVFIEYFGHKSVTWAFHCCMRATFVLCYLGQKSPQLSYITLPSLGTPHTFAGVHIIRDITVSGLPVNSAIRMCLSNMIHETGASKKSQIHSFHAHSTFLHE